MKVYSDADRETAVKKTYSLIGLSAKARFVTAGEFMTEKSIKAGNSFLVIVAGDASDNTKKKFSDMCSFRKLPIFFFGDKDSLGHAIGNEFRASVSINNKGMAEQIVKQLTVIETEQNNGQISDRHLSGGKIIYGQN